MLADPFVVRHLGGHTFRREDAWRRMVSASGFWDLLGYGYWAVEQLDGRWVGQVGFADFKRDLRPSIEGLPEMGWILARQAHGRGYASEAVAAALAWADANLSYTMFTAIIDRDNKASIRVAEKAGFGSTEQALYEGRPILLLRRPVSPAAASAASATAT